ncbi:MAG: hypothetical protein ACPG6B_05715 [Oceanihabitans sp.]
MKSKILKIIALVFVIALLSFAGITGYSYYLFQYSLIPNEGEFNNDAHYINPEEAILNEGFSVCNESYIYQYYNTRISPYINGKNNFRNYINKNYQNRNYTDSGYFNLRFIINCNGKSGRFIFHENNLDLEPKAFSEDLKNQLIQLTTEIKQWRPVFLYEENRDAYMYVSYRIEHGEITEIIP